MGPRLASLFALAFMVAAASSARAAEPWVDRPSTLPQNVVSIDTGLGIATAPRPDLVANSYTGSGMNLEGAWGITDSFEVGLRTGLRFDVDGRNSNVDYYARTYDLQTYGTRTGNVADPEVRA